MFCTKCGTKNDDGAMFCSGCGNSLQQAAPVTPQEPVNQTWNATPEMSAGQGWTPEPAPAPKKKLPIVPIAIGGIAAVAVVILLFVLLGGGGSGYKKAVNDFLDATVKKPNFEKAVKLTVPKVCMDEAYKELEEELEDEGYADVDEYYDEMNEELKEDMEDIKVECSIKGAEQLDKMDKYEEESAYEDLDDLRDDLAAAFEEYGFDEDDLQDAYIVEVEMSVSYEGETEKMNRYLVAYKYDGAWYIDADVF